VIKLLKTDQSILNDIRAGLKTIPRFKISFEYNIVLPTLIITEAGSKTPPAAVVKSHGGKR